jgi:hypothetical protein
MRLSEAIKLGAMMKPQGFGVVDNGRNNKSCALLAAANAVGLKKLLFGNRHWPWPWMWTERTLARCPVRCEASADGAYHVGGLIAHLNDQHQWTREAIADWVATIEPADERPERTTGAECAVDPVDGTQADRSTRE